jgi:hypothetical protein
MKASAPMTTPRASRPRVVAALLAAGLLSGVFGGNLAGAGAQSTPADDDGAPATTTTATTTTATTPGDPPATTTPKPPPTTTTPAPASTTPVEPAAPAPTAPAAPQVPSAPTPPAKPKPGLPPASTPALPPFDLDGALKPIPFCTLADARHAISVARKEKRRLAEVSYLELLLSTRASEDCQPPEAEDDTTGETASGAKRGSVDDLDEDSREQLRNEQGVPTVANPTMSLALPGAAPIGVPNFFIDKFRIPVFLLPIYQAAGIQYGVRWEVLAAINEIETDYGRNLNVSSAGALGWMQFIPSTWKQYGVDANDDGRKDPFNPVDAIFAAARYLKAAGAGEDLRKAIFAYNHADWYVESVLMRARVIGGLPSDLVGSLSGLTQGRFPVYARARYADDLSERRASRRVAIGENAAMPVDSDRARRGIDIFAKPGSPVVAVQDGRIVALGRSKRLGRYVKLADAFGNTYTYARLKKLATRVPVPKSRRQSKASIARELALPAPDAKPSSAASAGRPTDRRPALTAAEDAGAEKRAQTVGKERLFAHPERANARSNGGDRQLAELESDIARDDSLRSYLTGSPDVDAKDVVLKSMVRGRQVLAGTILGRIGTVSKRVATHMHFEIRPSGRGAPRIDPKPILDGWKLLEATAIYRARGKNPLSGSEALSAPIGQVMLMSKEALTRRVLHDPRIEIYSCGRRDIESGGIDRRVLATLAFLAASGLKPTVTSLYCGHSRLTTSGNVSEHSAGSAVDIAKINDIPIIGHQGEGSIADIAIRRLLTLQGTMRPHQIISLMTYAGADNTLAMGDHADHIHVGFQPAYTPGSPEAKTLASVLKPTQWVKLIDRLGRINNPDVARTPSRYAIRVPVPRASAAHRGE